MMGIFKPKGASKVWWMDIHFKGRRIRESTGLTNKKQAERMYSRRESQFIEDTFFDNPLDKTITFDPVLDRYQEEVTPEKAEQTQFDEKRYALVLSDYFGDKFLYQITTNLISQFRLQRKKDFQRKWKKKWEKWSKKERKCQKGKEKNYGKRTINRELSLLSAVFTQTIKIWGIYNFNPVSCINRERAPERVKYFADDMFEQIFECLPEWIRPIVLLSKNTGLRRSNVVNLQWLEVDVKERFIVLKAEVMKNAKHLGVPLNKKAFEVIMAQKNRKYKPRCSKKLVSVHSKYVFNHNNGKPFTVWGVTKAFKKACEEAEHDFCFHDLRHDYASKLVQQGVDIYTVQTLVGHKDISTTLRYAHLSPKRLREAVSVLGRQRRKKGPTAKTVSP